jgi:hypothetical protein
MVELTVMKLIIAMDRALLLASQIKFFANEQTVSCDQVSVESSQPFPDKKTASSCQHFLTCLRIFSS